MALVEFTVQPGDHTDLCFDNKRTYVILVQEHVQLLSTDSEICLVKLVRNVPAERTKLASLLDEGMEETQSEEEFLEVW